MVGPSSDSTRKSGRCPRDGRHPHRPGPKGCLNCLRTAKKICPDDRRHNYRKGPGGCLNCLEKKEKKTRKEICHRGHKLASPGSNCSACEVIDKEHKRSNACPVNGNHNYVEGSKGGCLKCLEVKRAKKKRASEAKAQKIVS